MTRGTCVTHATLAVWTAQVSWLAAPVTPSPTKQSKYKGKQQQISSWRIHKTQMWVNVLFCSCSHKSSPTIGMMHPKMLIVSILRFHLMQTSKTGLKLKNTFALDNWEFALVGTSKQILNKIQITNLYYKLSFTWMLQFTQLSYTSNNYGGRYHLFS